MKKNNKIEDPRIIRTKEKFQQSLCNLLLNKSLDQITVSELSELANINRSTFYLHYSNVSELYQELKTNILEQYQESLIQYSMQLYSSPMEFSQASYQESDYGKEKALLEETFHFLKKNKKYIPIILAQGYGDQILVELISAGKEVFLQNLYANKSYIKESEQSYYFSYVVNGIIAVIRSWVESGMKESPKKMAEITIRFIY